MSEDDLYARHTPGAFSNWPGAGLRWCNICGETWPCHVVEAAWIDHEGGQR